MHEISSQLYAFLDDRNRRYASCRVGAAQQIQINKDQRTTAITATDSARALADTATVHVGFVAYAPDAQTAYAEGSKTSNAIIGALTDKGVAKTAIESETQNVAETQSYELEKVTPAERAQRRFQMRQSWTVQTRADEAASLLNTAVHAGANQSGQIDWTICSISSDLRLAVKFLLRSGKTLDA
ncbi:MAG TPA: SIMPL domain-containing protein [Acidobacteriaceae bacterium]|nr:SIMPL domain-containing protein [Acidobacteriaceae bacterium]